MHKVAHSKPNYMRWWLHRFDDAVVGHLGRLLGQLDLVRSQEKVSNHKVSNHSAQRKGLKISSYKIISVFPRLVSSMYNIDFRSSSGSLYNAHVSLWHTVCVV